MSKADHEKAERMRAREKDYLGLGKKLKNAAEELINSAAAGASRDVKRGCAVCLEGIVAFAMGFYMQNARHGLLHHPNNPQIWSSLFPLIDFLHSKLRHLPSPSSSSSAPSSAAAAAAPLRALLLIIHAAAIDEMLRCQTTHETPPLRAEELVRLIREKGKLLAQAREVSAGVRSDRLRVGGGSTPGGWCGVWSTMDETCEMALRMLRRWCSEEGVEWTQEISTRAKD